MAKKFSKWKSFRKGLLPAIGAYVAATVATMDGGMVLADPEAALVAVAVGIIPAVINAWKNRHLQGNPFYTSPYSGYVLMLCAGLAMAAGCATTVNPDGSRTYQIDPVALQTAWELYETLEARHDALEAEQDAADDAERQRIEAELRRLEPEIREAWARILAMYPPGNGKKVTNE